MKVSVIVPVYNVEKYIQRCVESLTKQTIKDIDIVLVDDGSTDNSPSMIDEYARQDERIQVVHKANAGQGLARNDGLKIARGKYVCFLDSDDYVETNMCEQLYELMERTGADMCTFGHRIDAPDGTLVRAPRILDNEYLGEAVRKDFTLHYYGDDPADDNLRGYSSCMSIFRLSVIRDNGLEFLSERKVLSEDNLFCLKFCEYANKVVTTSNIYYHYCQKEDSFSQGYSAVRMPMTKVLISHFREYATKYGVADKAQIRIAGLVWINMMATIKQDVRRKMNGEVSGKVVRKDIRELCYDEEFRNEIKRLKGSALPMKQKVFLWAYLCKMIWPLYFMAAIRAGERI